MATKLRYVGLDVHKDSIVVAVADSGRQPAEVFKKLANDFHLLKKALTKLGPPERLRICYEAGPTGFDLARRLTEAGYHCEVIAPSLVPQHSGKKRIKTDRRDARNLAQFYRSGSLTPICIPERQTEAMRDLERARDDAKHAERAAKHQLDKFLLRHGRNYTDGKKWTKRHWEWIARQAFPEGAQQYVLEDYVAAVKAATQRVQQLTDEIGRQVETWTLLPLVQALTALRGFQQLSAVIVAAEIGDFARFAHPSSLMDFVGLVPSESSSGEKRWQGRITGAGNGHVRRILVEAAWAYQFAPRPGREIRQRREAVAPQFKVIAEKAEQRLCRRFRALRARGKPSQKVVTAIARELAGFVWAIAQEQRRLAS
jgi:transposase